MRAWSPFGFCNHFNANNGVLTIFQLGAVGGRLNNKHAFFVDSVGLTLSQTPFGIFLRANKRTSTKFYSGRGFVDVLSSKPRAMHKRNSQASGGRVWSRGCSMNSITFGLLLGADRLLQGCHGVRCGSRFLQCKLRLRPSDKASQISMQPDLSTRVGLSSLALSQQSGVQTLGPWIDDWAD